MPVGDDQTCMFVLDEHSADGLPWMRELERHFAVLRATSVVGVQRLVQGRKVSAAVLFMTSPETRARRVVLALRGQPAFATIPVIVLAAGNATQVERALEGMPRVDVVEAARAHLVLRPRLIGMIASPASSELRSTKPAARPSARAARGPAHVGLQNRFFEHGTARAQRALVICGELRRTDVTPATRMAALEELKDLLNLMKGEATLLRMRALAEVFTMAEQIVGRLDGHRRGIVVPRGVLGLLNELADFNHTGDLGASFDVDMHKIRLSAAQANVSIHPSVRPSRG